MRVAMGVAAVAAAGRRACLAMVAAAMMAAALPSRAGGGADAGLQRRYYSEGDTVVAVPAAAAMFAVEMRAALPDAAEGRGCSAARWGLEDAAGQWAMLVGFNHDYGAIDDRRGVRVSCGYTDLAGRRVATDSVDLYSGVDALRGYNTLALEWRRDGGRSGAFAYGGDAAAAAGNGGGDSRLDIYVGSDEARLAMSLAAPMPVGPVRVVGAGRRIVQTLVAEWSIDAAEALLTPWTAEALAAHLAASSDPMEGYWSYFDRRTDDDRARLGGKYRLAVVAGDAPGSYDLLYAGGATVGEGLWRPLMLKGRLAPSRFEMLWSLTWFDAVAVMLDDDEAYATFSPDEGVLTLEFPIYRSRLRFARE